MPEITVKGFSSIILAFSTALIITWYYIPRIVKVARSYKLGDRPVRHKIHKGLVPTLGGIGIFAGFTVAFLISVNGYVPGISYFAAAALLIFFVGITDDLLTIKPVKKIIAETGAIMIIVLFTDLRFTSLHGFLGISEVPAWASYIITIFLMIVIINAVNLIDGIDGLASSVGIIASIAFGLWFYLSGDIGYTVLSASILGALIVFLNFNISDGPYKIFMGDSGSLVLGFILAIFAVHFNEINLSAGAFHKLDSSPSVSIAILIIPLFDTIRVFFLRIRDHKHPFDADNRHMHHMMLRAGFSHVQATAIISLLNVTLIAVAFLLDHIGILYLGLVLLTLCMSFMGVIMRMIRKTEKQQAAAQVPQISVQKPEGVRIKENINIPKTEQMTG